MVGELEKLAYSLISSQCVDINERVPAGNYVAAENMNGWCMRGWIRVNIGLQDLVKRVLCIGSHSLSRQWISTAQAAMRRH